MNNYPMNCITVTMMLGILDPEGLVTSGAPWNEYAPEADCISTFISEYEGYSIYDLAYKIQDTFEEFFENIYDIEYCMYMAEKLIEAIEE